MGATNTQVTASVQSVSDSTSSGENGHHQKPKRDVKGAIKTIFIGVALPCLIILSVIAVLLSIIFTHQVIPWSGYPELTSASTTTKANNLPDVLKYVKYTAGPAYLVKTNPSTLTTIAQLTGKVTPYLTSSIMALVAFFAARHIVLESKKAEDASLPTPEHLTLLINLLSGNNFDPLIDTASFWWQSKRRLPAPIPAVFWSLCTITCMGLLIPAVDTWFGAATRAIPFTQLSKSESIETYGRQLDMSPNSSCAGGPSNALADEAEFAEYPSFWPCSVNIIDGTAINSSVLSLTKPIDAFKLQYAVNTSTALSAFTHGSKQYYFYTDPRVTGHLDFSASSPAISTQCLPMTSSCLNSSSEGGFSCSSGFSGSLGESFPLPLYTPENPYSNGNAGSAQDTENLGIGFSTTADLLDRPPLTYPQWDAAANASYPSFLAQNPQYFGTWAVDYPDKVALSFSELRTDPEIITITSGGTVWFLNCTTVVANATYTFVNGSIATFNPIAVDDEAMANLFTAPFNLFHLNQVLGTSMTNMAMLAALTSTSTELANTWAAEFSKTALSLANGVFVPLSNSLQQDRTDMIVARLPKVPLFILIGLKLVYVVALIVLAIGAYAFAHPAETEVVKQQLSTKGLAAAYFDDPGLLQANAVNACKELASPTPDEKSSAVVGKVATTQVNEILPGESAATSPADLNNGSGPKVGLVANAQGAWTFAVKADGVWLTIRPIVNLFVDSEVKDGNLSQTAGEILKSL